MASPLDILSAVVDEVGLRVGSPPKKRAWHVSAAPGKLSALSLLWRFAKALMDPNCIFRLPNPPHLAAGKVSRKSYGIFVRPAVRPSVTTLRDESRAKLQLVHWLATDRVTAASRVKNKEYKNQQDRLQRFIEFPPLPEDDPFDEVALTAKDGVARELAMECVGDKSNTRFCEESDDTNRSLNRIARTCLRCYNSKVKCDRKSPCHRCMRIGMDCVPRDQRRRARGDSPQLPPPSQPSQAMLSSMAEV